MAGGVGALIGYGCGHIKGRLKPVQERSLIGKSKTDVLKKDCLFYFWTRFWSDGRVQIAIGMLLSRYRFWRCCKKISSVRMYAMML